MSRRRAVIVAGVVVVAAAGTAAWAANAGSGAAYRTATVSRGAVQQTLSGTGTVGRADAASLDFQVAGTVAKVEVKSGQHVAAGQVLARLDRRSLRAAVKSATSSLASANARLSTAESGQVAATSDTSASASRSTSSASSSTPTLESARSTAVVPSPQPSQTGSPHGSSGAAAGSPTSITAAQARVREAQATLDRDLPGAKAEGRALQQACGHQALADAPSSTSPVATPTASPSPSPTTGASSGSGAACAAAASAMLQAQQRVDRDEQSLATAEAGLARMLSSAAGSKGSSSTGSYTGSSSTGTPSSSSTTASAADIALDQASVDQARAQLASARSDLRQATLRSTIAGRVAAVTVKAGDSVSGSSSATTPAVEVAGSTQTEVTLAVSDSQVRRLREGMPAQVVTDGTSRRLTATVTAIAVGGSQSSTGAVSYPVTVTLAGHPSVVDGAAAAVTVVLSSVNGVVTVPTSAVHRSGTETYVELRDAGKTTRRNIKVGAVGPARTQVTSGLTIGQTVVLADLDAALPSSSSTVTSGFGGGGTRRVVFGGAGGSASSGGAPAGAPLGFTKSSTGSG